MKRKTAREILADSFRELAAENSVDRITIRTITENCGYSPATFYRQFRDKYDLIAWDYSRRIGEIMGGADAGGTPWRQAVVDGANFYAEQKAYLANLFLHTNGLDSFIHNMVQTNCRHLKARILHASGLEALDVQTEMLIRLYCSGTVALTCEWVLGKYDAGPGELAAAFEQSLPMPLRRYVRDE